MSTFYITLIVLGSIFLLVLLILIPLFIKGRKKDRVLKGKKVLERKKKKENGKDGELGRIDALLEYCKWSYIPLIIGYVILIIVFSKASPDTWKIWRSSDFFWLSHIAILLTFWLLTIKGYSRVIAIAILSLLAFMGVSNWPEGKTDDTDTVTGSSYGQVQETRNNVRTEKITSYPGVHTKKTVPYGYDWMLTRDASYGFVNANKPMWVSVNDGTPRKDIGSQSINVFPKGAEFIKFIPEGNESIYLVYSLMKRK